MHITTKFIGEWPEARLGELEKGLEGVRWPRFEVEVGRFGFFPTPQHPHTFFAGVEGGPALQGLAAETERAVVEVGGAAENRAYTPHLTLARIRNQEFAGLREAIGRMGAGSFGTFSVANFHLYLSEPDFVKPGPGGSVYRTLATYSIEGAE